MNRCACTEIHKSVDIFIHMIISLPRKGEPDGLFSFIPVKCQFANSIQVGWSLTAIQCTHFLGFCNLDRQLSGPVLNSQRTTLTSFIASKSFFIAVHYAIVHNLIIISITLQFFFFFLIIYWFDNNYNFCPFMSRPILLLNSQITKISLTLLFQLLFILFYYFLFSQVRASM